MSVIVSLRHAPWKGRLPVSISNMSTPSDHQSAAVEWPRRLTTSGAMYSTVPQNEYVRFSSESSDSFDRPKSVSLMCPSASSRMLRR